MGQTLRWRAEQPREPGRYGRSITFGNLRDKGTAYMSYSDRVGPGIVVLGGSPSLCDRLTEEGFTALAPDLTDVDEIKAGRLLDAAIEHLVDNWHPRCGVIALDRFHALAERCRKSLDAVGLFHDEVEIDAQIIDDLRYDLS